MTHLLVSTLFLVLGGLFYLIALTARAYPHVLEGRLSAGLLRPMAMTLVFVGWLVPALAGAIYYVLPRLTGTLLWKEDRVVLSAWAHGGLALAGVVVIALGLGDGVQPLALPWWFDIPVLAIFSIPAVVVIQTVRKRSESGVYVTLWFVMAAAVWLPMLYLVNNLPGLNAVARSLQEVGMSAGFSSLWVITVGTGVAYYTVAKVTDAPLANRQLAWVGFWSLVVAATWAGPAQLSFGPTPAWLGQIAAVLTLALPVAAVANALALSLTAGDSLASPGESLRATMWGMGLVVVGSVFTSVASFGSAAALLSFTSFWDGIEFMLLFGAGGLLVAGWVYQALPVMTGLHLYSASTGRRHIRLTVFGALATGALLMIAGISEGFRWVGGSFGGAYADVGSAWSPVGRGLVTAAVFTGLVVLIGQVIFALNVFKTMTAGTASLREAFVRVGENDE